MSTSNGNGSAPSVTQRKLEQLLHYHLQVVQALQTTLGLLNGHADAERKERAPSILATAMELDMARRAAKPRAQPKPPGWHTQNVKRRRAETAKLLDRFDATTPSRHPTRTLGVLIQHGFLKKKGDGYIRTAKPFIP
jgi:hypothetical protein